MLVSFEFTGGPQGFIHDHGDAESASALVHGAVTQVFGGIEELGLDLSAQAFQAEDLLAVFMHLLFGDKAQFVFSLELFDEVHDAATQEGLALPLEHADEAEPEADEDDEG